MTRIRFEGLRSSRTLSARGAPLSVCSVVPPTLRTCRAPRSGSPRDHRVARRRDPTTRPDDATRRRDPTTAGGPGRAPGARRRPDRLVEINADVLPTGGRGAGNGAGTADGDRDGSCPRDRGGHRHPAGGRRHVRRGARPRRGRLRRHRRPDQGRRWRRDRGGRGRGRRGQRDRGRGPGGRGAGRADRAGEQRRHHPGQPAVQDERRRLGRRHGRAPARGLPDDQGRPEAHGRPPSSAGSSTCPASRRWATGARSTTPRPRPACRASPRPSPSSWAATT